MSLISPPAGQPITVYANAFKALDFTIRQRGSKVNLTTAGVGVKMHIGYLRPSADAVGTVLLSKEWSEAGGDSGIELRSGVGEIRVRIESSDTFGPTASLHVGKFFYDIWLHIGGKWYMASAPAPFLVEGGVGR
jgi:hypothetical protein